MKDSYIFLAPGFEETEAIVVTDIMRRAGMPVSTVSIGPDRKVKGANGITVEADTTIDNVEINEPEWLICPGGMPGATNLAACAKVTGLLEQQFNNGGKIAAICASPAVVLAPLGILDGREATCYPGFEQLCPSAILKDSPVVALPTLVTGNGPAAAIGFALAIVKESMGEEKSREVGLGLLYYPEDMNFYF